PRSDRPAGVLARRRRGSDRARAPRHQRLQARGGRRSAHHRGVSTRDSGGPRDPSIDDVDEDAIVDQLSDLIGFIARALVDEPDEVKVEVLEEDDDPALIFELTVAPDDLGKV